jgi:membrane protein
VTRLESFIYHLKPVVFIINKSKRVRISGSGELFVYDVSCYFFKQVKRVGLNERAAAISFNLIQALPAALLFLFSIIPYLPESLNARKQVLGLFKDLTPNSSTYTLIQGTIDTLFKKHVGIFSFGFVLLVFYSSNAMLGVIRTFDKSISENKIFFLHRRWRAIKLTVILFLLFLLSVFMLTGQHQLAQIIKDLFHMKRKTHIPGWKSIRWMIIISLIFFGIGIIYKYAPSVKKRWSLFSTGAVLATVLTLITTIAFSYWVNNFASYNKVYGSIGTILVIMLLFYLNSLILLIGFELNVTIMYLHSGIEEKMLKEPGSFPK